MMKKRKLGIIGGSGLYKMEGFKKSKWKKIKTPWGSPSDEILIAEFENEEIYMMISPMDKKSAFTKAIKNVIK